MIILIFFQKSTKNYSHRVSQRRKRVSQRDIEKISHGGPEGRKRVSQRDTEKIFRRVTE